MILKTRVFNLYNGRFRNLSELAKAMEISVSQIYRVLEGKRNINRKFIIGAIKAFPGYKFDDLFYFVPTTPAVKTANPNSPEETKGQTIEPPKST
jgi:predicted transcriptional regulator